jgi:hypothetical protein
MKCNRTFLLFNYYNYCFSELRDQIRKARLEEDKALSHLQRVKNRNEQLEAEMNVFREQGMCLIEPSTDGGDKDKREVKAGPAPLNIPNAVANASVMLHSPGLGYGGATAGISSDLVGKLNTQLVQVLHELNAKSELNLKLKDEVSVLHRRVGVCRHQMGLLYEDFNKEREQWKEKRIGIEREKEQIREKLSGADAKTQEYEQHLKAIITGIFVTYSVYIAQLLILCVISGGDVALDKLADSTRAIALLRSNEAIMVRRFKAVNESEADLRKMCIKLKDEMVAVENGMIEKMGVLQR